MYFECVTFGFCVSHILKYGHETTLRKAVEHEKRKTMEVNKSGVKGIMHCYEVIIRIMEESQLVRLADG